MSHGVGLPNANIEISTTQTCLDFEQSETIGVGTLNTCSQNARMK